MKIRHERPMSDLSFQVRAPLGLELSTGERLTIANWSLQGFEFPGQSQVLPKEAVLSIPFQGVDIRFPVRLAREGKGQFLRFEGLSGRQRETMAVFYRSILSGKMASTEEIITSLDTPVDLVPMEETEEEQNSTAPIKTPRGLKAALHVLVYLCIAGFTAWTLGSGIWGKLATIQIQNARIEAELLPHSAAARGYVKEIAVAEGDSVLRGEVLVRLSDPQGEAALAEVRGRIDLIERRLARAIADEQTLAARIAQERLAIAARAPPGSELLRQQLEAFDGRYAEGYRDLFDAYDIARQQVDSLTDEFRRLKRERGRLRDAGDALNVLAQQDGIVTAIPVLKGQLVGRGTQVAMVEGLAARQARGWLDQSKAVAVFVGMPVVTQLTDSGGNRRLAGRIAAIEAAIDPALSPEFGMLVTVEFPTLSAQDTRQSLPHLAPVELQAKRAWALAREQQWLALLARVGL